MKIRERHPNGAEIQVKGWWGVRQVVTEWRNAQEPVENEEEEKRVVGFTA